MIEYVLSLLCFHVNDPVHMLFLIVGLQIFVYFDFSVLNLLKNGMSPDLQNLDGLSALHQVKLSCHCLFFIIYVYFFGAASM